MADQQDALPLIQDLLLRRMRTMVSLDHDAVDTMDLHHVNHVDAEGHLPIAFSLYHHGHIHDATFMGITGQLPIWNDDRQDRVQVAIPAHGNDRPVSEMANQHIGDYDVFGRDRVGPWLPGLGRDDGVTTSSTAGDETLNALETT